MLRSRSGTPARWTVESGRVLLLATIALLAIEIDVTIWAHEGGANEHQLRVGLSAYHFPLAALVVLTIARAAVQRSTPRTYYSKLVLVTAGWIVLSFAVSPSLRGLDVLLHLLGVWAIWRTLVESTPKERRVLLLGVWTFGVLQAALALAQWVNGAPIGIAALEATASLDAFGAKAVRGSFTHPYPFLGFVLTTTAAAFVLARVTRSGTLLRQTITASLVLLGLVVPLTASRAAWLAAIPMVAVLVMFHRSDLGRATIAWVSGLVLGAVVGASSTVERLASTSSGGRGLDTGRSDLLRYAGELTERHPVTGVGPGNYVQELRNLVGTTLEDGRRLQPPHNVVAHAAAELGIVGAGLVLCCLVALVVWAIRGGSLRLVTVSALFPFFLLDLFPYGLQIGLVTSGIWIGVCLVAARGELVDPLGADPDAPSSRRSASSHENR